MRAWADGSWNGSVALASVIFVFAIALGACGSKSESEKWSAKTEDTFLSSCKSSAMGAGADATAAEATCGCALRGLEATVSEVDLSRAETQMSQGKPMPDSFATVMGKCRVSASAH